MHIAFFLNFFLGRVSVKSISSQHVHFEVKVQASNFKLGIHETRPQVGIPSDLGSSTLQMGARIYLYSPPQMSLFFFPHLSAHFFAFLNKLRPHDVTCYFFPLKKEYYSVPPPPTLPNTHTLIAFFFKYLKYLTGVALLSAPDLVYTCFFFLLDTVLFSPY